MIVYLNGHWLDAREAAIPIGDRGFLLADGVFETGRLYQGRYFRLDEHFARLAESALQLRLTPPPADELRDIALQLAQRNRLSDGSLRITLTRGPGGRGLGTRGAGPQTLLATLSPLAQDWRARAEKGWTVITARTRRPAPESVPAQLKALGRVYSVLATLEAEAAGADDALLLSAHGHVAEGPTWNFFWRRGRTIRTASLAAGILEGVTRGIVLQLAREAGYTIEEGLWFGDDATAADEAFASMTSAGIVPVRNLDHCVFPSADCAADLQRRYWAYVERSLA